MATSGKTLTRNSLSYSPEYATVDSTTYKEAQMKLVKFDFPYSGPFGTEMTAAMDGLARSILQEPGFLWKIWLENRTTQELKKSGIDRVHAKIFDVNVPLTKFTNGPV
jgi:hypothetical protein